jgi:Ca-activated chloride channel family protein
MSPAVLFAEQAVRFAEPGKLWWLLVVPVAIGLLAWNAHGRRRARSAWAGTLFARLASGWDPGRERLKVTLFLLACSLVVLALARPQWGGETIMMKRRGIDLFIAIDTSASMLAEDMRPNRLEQAKREVADLVQRMGGDRIGLIAFAGSAQVACPLTLDHGTVLLLLESLNVNTVSTPGTNVGEAIRKARESFAGGEDKHKAMVLVTDGESHEGDALTETKKAAEEGLIIYTIGIGSPDGEPIPERTEAGQVAGYKRDRSGNVVSTKLDQATLESIARDTKGTYFRATPQGMELAAVLEDLQAIEKKELEGSLSMRYEERFQWPLGLAIVLLALEFVLPARRRRRQAEADLREAA